MHPHKKNRFVTALKFAALPAALLAAGSAQAQVQATQVQANVAAQSVYPQWSPYSAGVTASPIVAPMAAAGNVVAPGQVASPMYYSAPQVAWAGASASPYAQGVYGQSAYGQSPYGQSPYGGQSGYLQSAYPAGYANSGFPAGYTYIPSAQYQPTQIVNEPAVVAATPEPVYVQTAVPEPMQAPEPEWDNQFYGSVKFAGILPSNSRFDLTETNSGEHLPDAGMGYGLSVAAGTRMNFPTGGAAPNIRLELQGSRYSYALDDATFTNGTADGFAIATGADPALFDTLSDGTETFTGAFANSYLEVASAGDISRLRAYLGGGIGYGVREAKLTYKDAAATSGGGAVATDATTSFNLKSDGVAYQAMAGIGMDLTRYLGIEVGYKWMRIPELEAKSFNVLDQSLTTDDFTISSEDRDLHIIEGGFTVRY